MDVDREPAAAGTDPAAVRCPACAARCAPGAPWCSLCFADLGAAPSAEPGASAGSDASAGPDAPAEPDAPAGLPDPAEELRRGVGTLGAPRLPLVSDLLAGPGGAVAVMLGGTVVVGGCAVALMWVLGALL